MGVSWQNCYRPASRFQAFSGTARRARFDRFRVSENAPARLMDGATILKCSEFSEAIVFNME